MFKQKLHSLNEKFSLLKALAQTAKKSANEMGQGNLVFLCYCV